MIIESDLLDQIEKSPQDLYSDATRLDWSDDGSVVVSSAGELSDALGLDVGDVLIDVNGYSFDSILDTSRLYHVFRGAESLTLTFERRGREMEMIYVID